MHGSNHSVSATRTLLLRSVFVLPGWLLLSVSDICVLKVAALIGSPRLIVRLAVAAAILVGAAAFAILQVHVLRQLEVIFWDLRERVRS